MTFRPGRLRMLMSIQTCMNHEMKCQMCIILSLGTSRTSHPCDTRRVDMLRQSISFIQFILRMICLHHTCPILSYPARWMHRFDFDQRNAQNRLQNSWLTLLEQGESRNAEQFDLKHALCWFLHLREAVYRFFVISVSQVQTVSGSVRYLTIASAWIARAHRWLPC